MFKIKVNLNGAGNVETLLHARNVKLDHSQVFAFHYDTSKITHKSGKQQANMKGEAGR